MTLRFVTESRFDESETAEENRIAGSLNTVHQGCQWALTDTNSRNPCDWVRHRNYPETQHMAFAAYNIIRKY